MRLNSARFALAILLTSVAAHAAVINTYSTQGAFSNASTGLTVIDFPSAATNLPGGTYTDGSVSVDGTYYGSPQLNIVDPMTLCCGNAIDWGYLFATIPTGGADTDRMVIHTAGVTAAAMSLATFYLGHQIQITLSTGDVFLITPNSSAPVTLWGFTSDTAITTIELKTTDGGAPMVAHLEVGSLLTSGGGGGGDDPPADTPEVMTMLTLGAGLVAMTLMKKMKAAGNTAAA